MATNVFANNNEIVSKGADGKSVAAFPDVCWTPPAPPVGPIPIPYPNSTEDKDLDNGTTTVQIKDKTVCMGDTSYIAKSKGDEGATQSQQKNMLTSTIQGKGYFITSSQDVKVEGKGATRHLDMMTHNHASPAGTPPQAEASGTGSGGEGKKLEENSTPSKPLEIISVALTRRNVVDADGKLKTLNIVNADKVQNSNEFYQNNKEKTEEFQDNKKNIERITSEISKLNGENEGHTEKIAAWTSRLKNSRDKQNIQTLNDNINRYKPVVDMNLASIASKEKEILTLETDSNKIASSTVEYANDPNGCIQFVNIGRRADKKCSISYTCSRYPLGTNSIKSDEAINYINIPYSMCSNSVNSPIISSSMLGPILEFQVLLNRGHVSPFDSITVILEKQACKEANGKFFLSKNFVQVDELKNLALMKDVVVYNIQCKIDASCFTSYRVTAFVCDSNKDKISESAVESVCVDTWKKIMYTKSIIDNSLQYQGMKMRVNGALVQAKMELQDLRIDMQEMLELNICNVKNKIGFLVDKDIRKTVNSEIDLANILESEKQFLKNFRYICHILFLEHGNSIQTNNRGNIAIFNQVIDLKCNTKGTCTGQTVVQLNKNSPENALVNHNFTDGGCLVDIKDGTGVSILSGTPISNSNYARSVDKMFVKISFIGQSGQPKKYKMFISIPEAAKKDSSITNLKAVIEYIVYDVSRGLHTSSGNIVVSTCFDRLDNYTSNNPNVTLLEQAAIENILLHELGHYLGAVGRSSGTVCSSHCYEGLATPPADPPTAYEVSNATCQMFPANTYEGSDAKNRKYFCTDCKKELISFS